MEVYSWFALGSMPLASESRTAINPITGEEDTFQRVDSPYFSNYEGLKNYLSHFFSDEIIEYLLEEYPVCKDIDGTLYMIPTGRGANIFIKDVVFSTEEVTDTSPGFLPPFPIILMQASWKIQKPMNSSVKKSMENGFSPPLNIIYNFI